MWGEKGTTSIVVKGIVVLILAVTFLGLAIAFTRQSFSGASGSMESQAQSEPEPPAPTPQNPITLSREAVSTGAGQAVTLKVSVLNPTESPWRLRDDLASASDSCGNDFDNICFIDAADQSDICSTGTEASAHDNDCMAQGSVAADGVCVKDNTQGGTPPAPTDSDCGPVSGTEVVIACSDSVTDENAKRNIGQMMPGEAKTILMLLHIKAGAEKQTASCMVQVFAEDKMREKQMLLTIR